MDRNHLIKSESSGDGRMKKILVFVLFVMLLATLTACAPGAKINIDKSKSEIQFTTPGANPELDKPAENGKVAGLGTGLVHGFISPVTLIISFSNPAIQMYEVHNEGPMYNLGFLLGAILLVAILGFFSGRRR
jgi:hypothetical protein